MNEKYLWELWFKCKHPHPEYGGGDMVWPMEFAELIVWEAIGVCQVNVDALTSPFVDALTGPFLSEYEKGIVEGYRRANKNLRFYFGVEE